MDSLIVAAARALAAGDSLAALKRVSLRDDPPALALRGIAMAQLGEHARARDLLRRAARGFGAHEELSRARCVVAEAEVALAMRDLGGSPRTLAAAAAAMRESIATDYRACGLGCTEQSQSAREQAKSGACPCSGHDEITRCTCGEEHARTNR